MNVPERTDPQACSVRNKTTDIGDFVISNDIDIIRLTETWLTYNDAFKRGKLTHSIVSYIACIAHFYSELFMF